MATHQVLRTINSHGHQYRQRVELYYDPKKKQTRTRVLENLGPVTPIYRRPRVPTTTLPLEPVHFGVIATHLMTGSLTAHHIMDLIRDMGRPLPPGELTAAAIRFDLGEKNLSLLLCLTPPSSPPATARSVKRRGPSRAHTPPRSSPSKEAAD